MTNEKADTATSPLAHSLSWGGPSFPSYDGRMEDPPAATGSPAAQGSSSQGSQGAPAGSPSAGQGNQAGSSAGTGAGGSGSPTGQGQGNQGQQGGQGGSQNNDQNLAELRGRYETYRALGEPDAVKSEVESYRSVVQQSLDMGKKLGYTEEQLRTALKKDLMGAASFIRSKFAEASSRARSQQGQGQQGQQGQGQGRDQGMDPRVQAELQPIKEFIQHQRAEMAQSRFNESFDELVKAEFKDSPLSEEEDDFLFNMTAALLAGDREGTVRLRDEGKTSDVKKHFTAAKGMMDKYYAARTGRESKGQGGNGGPGQGGGPGNRGNQGRVIPKDLKIDDIIANPEKLNPRYAPK